MNRAILLFTLTFFIINLNVIGIQAQKDISFLTFNVWQEGTSVDNGLNKIRDVIIEVNPDVIGFSEIRNYNNEDWTMKIVNKLSDAGLKYYGSYAGGDVSIISKYPISDPSLIINGEGSIAKFNINLNNKTITVAVAHLDYTYYACYLPRGYNGGHPDWKMIDNGKEAPSPVMDIDKVLSYNLSSQRDEQLSAFLKAIRNETNSIILMGDFNEPSYLDWTNNTVTKFGHNGMTIPWQNTKSLLSNGFTDAYRSYFPDEVNNPGITWPSFVHGYGSTSWTPLADERDRLDYIFYKGSGITPVSVSLVGPKESYAYNKPTASCTKREKFIAADLEWPSDHKAVFVVLQFSTL